MSEHKATKTQTAKERKEQEKRETEAFFLSIHPVKVKPTTALIRFGRFPGLLRMKTLSDQLTVRHAIEKCRLKIRAGEQLYINGRCCANMNRELETGDQLTVQAKDYTDVKPTFDHIPEIGLLKLGV